MMATQMKPRKLPGVLVVGALAGTEPVLRQLETSGRYEFSYVPSVRKVEPSLLSKPSVVLLRLPAEREKTDEALSFISFLRKQAAVVVMSSTPDMRLYLSAMTLGAFDYFTSYTPVEEAGRVLDNAVSRHRRQAA
jgi:DNA-binding NtrC family response regulator